MDLTCLDDDAVQRSSALWGEHGLAFLVDTGDARVLFDTGQSGTVLLHNLDVLGVDPGSIDALVISHGHYDHTDGLFSLLEHLRSGTPLYAHSDLFRERYALREGVLEDVGLGSHVREVGAGEGGGGEVLDAKEMKAKLASRMTLRLDSERQQVAPGVWTTGEIRDRPEREGSSPHHRMQDGEKIVPDRYVDDMALVLALDRGLLLLCGCCHAGLLNTLMHVETLFEEQVEAIVGGLHLTGLSERELEHVCDVLRGRPGLRRVCPNHCTGEAAFVALTNALGSSVVRPCPAGTVSEV